MTLTQGILNKRPALALVTLFCLVEAGWSWTYIIKGVRHRPDIIVALFSVILVFILLSIAYRSSHFQTRSYWARLRPSELSLLFERCRYQQRRCSP